MSPAAELVLQLSRLQRCSHVCRRHIQKEREYRPGYCHLRLCEHYGVHVIRGFGLTSRACDWDSTEGAVLRAEGVAASMPDQPSQTQGFHLRPQAAGGLPALAPNMHRQAGLPKRSYVSNAAGPFTPRTMVQRGRSQG